MSNTLDRLSKILRLAESASTEAEAETYMEKAQALATEIGVELAVARAHQLDKEKRATPIVKKIMLGKKRQKGLAYFVNLASDVASANDVKMDILSNSTGVIAYGFESDIEVMEALVASLIIQMEVACAAYIKRGEFKSEKVWSRDEYGDITLKPMHGLTARKSFQEAFSAAAGRKVRTAAREAREAIQKSAKVAESVVEGQSSSVDIVLADKGIEVRDFYKSTSKAKGSWKGASSSTKGHSSSGYAAGVAAGRSANIGGNRALGGSRTAINA